jgi:hypothetical protein
MNAFAKRKGIHVFLEGGGRRGTGKQLFNYRNEFDRLKASGSNALTTLGND